MHEVMHLWYERVMRTKREPIEYPNHYIHPSRKLELARKAAGFQVQQLAVVLDVSRNAVTDMQTPGKIKSLNEEKVLKWCLACEVQPSWVSSEYAHFDEMIEDRILDLRERGTSFAEEVLGYDPRSSGYTEPAEVPETPYDRYEFLRVGFPYRERISRLRRYSPELDGFEPQSTYQELGSATDLALTRSEA